MICLPTSEYSSLQEYHKPQVGAIFRSIFETSPKVIVDLTAHVGGDTIFMADLFKNCEIYSIDIDDNAVKCLEKNVKGMVSNSKRVHIVCEDGNKWLRHKVKADMYYIDPPWGGKDYSLFKEIHLYLGGIPITMLINTILDLRLTKKIMLKVPKNFAYSKFVINDKDAFIRVYDILKPGAKQDNRDDISYSLILIEAD